MTCDDWRMEISEWLDNELDDAAQSPMYEHLATCSACRTFMADALRVHAALQVEGASYGTPQDHESTTRVPLLRRRIEVPFASVVLGIILACLCSLVLGASLAQIHSPERFAISPQDIRGVMTRNQLERELRP